jgi:hypothetical protein
VKIRYIVFISLVLLLIGRQQLAVNSNAAARRVKAIQAKDAAGEEVANDILELGRFSGRHMNTAVSFELQASYQRAVERAQAAAHPTVSDAIYRQAQAACGERSSSIAQAECTRQFVSSRLEPVPATNVKLPERRTYYYAFSSPLWTPDIAGLGLVLGGAGLLVSIYMYRRGLRV